MSYEDEEVEKPTSTGENDGLLEDIESKQDYKFWFRIGSDYMPGRESLKTNVIKPGLYKLGYDDKRGEELLMRQNLSTDDVLELPIEEMGLILKDITKFWERYDKYKEYGLTHKRGILMHGPPGCGKSYIIRAISQDIVAREGIVITLTNRSELTWYNNLLPKLRKISKDMPLITIIEDIDDLVSNQQAESTLLNILDGLSQVDRICYIATTNHPERLEARLLNRPSRFDRRYLLDLPTPEVRESYITQKLKKNDLEKIEIKEWVEKSKGLSIAHLRELIISVVIMDNTLDETIDILKRMKTLPAGGSASNIGFDTSR